MGPTAAPVRTATPNGDDSSASRAHAGLIDPPPAADPPTPEQIAALAAGNRRRRRIQRAVAMAAFNGWSTAAFAVLAMPFALFSRTALVMSLGLGVIAFFEFKGRRLLQQLNLKAPSLLGFNQIAFAGIIVAYCAWSIHANLDHPGRYAETIAANPELARILGPLGDLHKIITLAVYGCVATLSCLFQGSMAAYYFTRSSHLRAYVKGTPDWVLDLQRAT